MLQLLIDEDLVESSFLLGRKFLGEEEFATFAQREEFSAVNKEELTVSQVTGTLHEKLTGESLKDTRKRERSARRDAQKARRAAQREQKQAKKETAAKAVEKTPREIPTHSKEGLEYLRLAEYGFKRENFFFVPTARSFLKIKDHFLEQSIIGFDAEYHEGKVSTVTLASEEMVAVLDMYGLRKNKEVREYVAQILLSEDIEIVAHTFRLDAYYMSQYLEIDPSKIAKVLDLTEFVMEEGSENRMGLRQMVTKFTGKALNQYYKKKKWNQRPLPVDMIDYAGLNGFIVLKIFLMHDKESEGTEHPSYYKYEEPSNLPTFEKKPRTKKPSKPRRNKNPEEGEYEKKTKTENAPTKKATQKRGGKRGRGGKTAPRGGPAGEDSQPKGARPRRGRGGRRGARKGNPTQDE